MKEHPFKRDLEEFEKITGGFTLTLRVRRAKKNTSIRCVHVFHCWLKYTEEPSESIKSYS